MLVLGEQKGHMVHVEGRGVCLLLPESQGDQ